MALNFVRGFRRIGWVVTFPVATLIILALYDKTREFSSTDYEAAETNWRQEYAPGVPRLRLVEMPDTRFGGLSRPVQATGYFPADVPMDVVEKIVKGFSGRQEPPHGAYFVETDAGKNYIVDEKGNGVAWAFTVHTKVNKLKLAGLVTGSALISALIIQGSISVLAWVLRGFKG